MNLRFENDVKTYSIQTTECRKCDCNRFENDVKTYSIQTLSCIFSHLAKFENDVKTYSIQTGITADPALIRLRMM